MQYINIRSHGRSAWLDITEELWAGKITAESATQIFTANMRLNERNPHYLKSKTVTSKLQAPVFRLPYDYFRFCRS